MNKCKQILRIDWDWNVEFDEEQEEEEEEEEADANDEKEATGESIFSSILRLKIIFLINYTTRSNKFSHRLAEAPHWWRVEAKVSIPCEEIGVQ